MPAAWKVVGPNLEGGIYVPHRPRKLIFRPGTEVFDPASYGFCVHTRRDEAYRHARCNPGTRLVELEHGDTLDDWGSGPGRPCPNSGWARLRRARVVREIEVDRSDITPEEAATGKWWIPPSGVNEMINRAVDLFERFAVEDPGERSIHGAEHVDRVARNGRYLARRTPGADLMVVAAFAALHDACRPPERNHGARAAELARSLHRGEALLLDWEQLKTLCAALEGHAEGRTTADPTIGVCWDADRLDLPRCGIRVDRRFLSTAAAKARLG